MARSRQRERELARRRYERRRLREQQLRARRRRRNTVIGAALGTAAVITGVVLLVVYMFAGGSDKKPSVSAQGSPTPSASVSPSVTPSLPPQPCKPISPNPPAKGQPTIPPVNGLPPTTLKVKDVKVGKGKMAKAGSSLSVSYIGVGCSTGTVFDATYKDGGKPFTVSPLGRAGVIAGWNQGLIGVRAGGVRELIIPPSLGYGPQGSGPIGPNETLIFLVTVESVK